MDPESYQRAKKRVKKKKEFYDHLVSYVIINAFLIALNIWNSPGHFWFFYPLAGWGIGLAFHYYDVFGIPGAGHLDKNWEAREMEKELRRMGKTDDDFTPKPEKELELKEFKKLRKDWDDSEFV